MMLNGETVSLLEKEVEEFKNAVAARFNSDTDYLPLLWNEETLCFEDEGSYLAFETWLLARGLDSTALSRRHRALQSEVADAS